MTIRKYKLDNLYHNHSFLLHGQRLVDFLGYLHDVRPIIHKLQSLIIQVGHLMTSTLAICLQKLIKKVEIIPRSLLIEVK